MTAPDVLILSRNGELYDDTRRAWRGTAAVPLVPEHKPRPLHHAETCCYRHNPDLVEVCPCTRRQRDWRAAHPL